MTGGVVTEEVHRAIVGLVRETSAPLAAARARIRAPTPLDPVDDALQEPPLKALRGWAGGGLASNPAAWLSRVAKHLAIDASRRARNLASKETERLRWAESAQSSARRGEEPAPDELRDDRLRLMFICCHEAL